MNYNQILSERVDKVIYLDGNTVIKVFNEDYVKSDILNEALNQARVENIGLNVPKILEVTKIDGKWAIIMEYIKGKTLAELMKENPHKEQEYIELFVDLQMKMHQTRSPLLNNLQEKMYRKIEETSISATIRYELHLRLGGMPKHNKVCHGDFNPHNIIIADNGDNYIIDWSHVTKGNASADVARTYLLFKLLDNDVLAEKYLNLFCEMSDTDKQYIIKWLPIVAASQLVKDKVEERELLLSWLDVNN